MMLARFGHDVECALATYNGGRSGAVEKYASIPPYVEAHNYVKRVLGYYERDVSATP
ncbi:MAG: lytic transglycosylase domain-containing protein [Pseudomonadota bacterium]|nr:lytic transglycosylase domain-containing protein [Pseudomonadota bacterium]